MRKKELHVNQCKSYNMIKMQFSFYYYYSSDFEEEVGYPKQSARFLDLSFRGICTDLKGNIHDINKDLITSKHSKNKFTDFI